MASSDQNLREAQRYYQSCLVTRKTAAASAEAVSTALSSINQMTSIADLPRTLARLQSAGVHALFAATPVIDPGDPSRYVIDIIADGVSLPSAISYADSKLRVAYQAHMTALAQTATTAGITVAINTDDAYGFERAIIAAGGSSDSDPVAAYNPTAIADLATALPNFDWDAYLRGLGFGSVADVNLVNPGYLPGLASIFSSIPFNAIQHYLTWRVLEAFANRVDRPMIDEEFAFHQTVVNGNTVQSSDQGSCLFATRDSFGFVLAQHLVESLVGSDVKPAADNLVQAVRSAMSANFDQVSWLDDATRAEAQAKLALLLPKVGYPDQWPTGDVGLPAAGSYLANWVAVSQHAQQQADTQLAGPVDRALFWASPEITNAFYSPDRNDITIPVAVLQDPFFNQKRLGAFNFGALGSVVGHEMTHGFDSNGRHYDGTGTLRDWWTPGAAAEFDRRTQCLIDQFSGYEAVPGAAVDGKVTLNEDIADLGGVKLAYAAFQTQPKPTNGSTEFSAEQQFFLSFAQMWCGNQSDDAARALLAIDVHSPAKYRVNGVVRNVSQFADIW
jgi:predicted metalloendopeptidase